jgi:hypothetical protein
MAVRDRRQTDERYLSHSYAHIAARSSWIELHRFNGVGGPEEVFTTPWAECTQPPEDLVTLLWSPEASDSDISVVYLWDNHTAPQLTADSLARGASYVFSEVEDINKRCV